jgi:hypothetical protein
MTATGTQCAMSAATVPRDWLVETLAQYYHDAAGSVPAERLDFRIANKTIRFCFAGTGLATQLTRALSHLRAGVEHPQCTVRVWDAKSYSGYPSILLRAYLASLESVWWDFVNARGELLEFHQPPFMAAYSPGTNGLSILDTAKGAGFYWKSQSLDLPYYEAGSPFRTLLHWWLRSQGVQFVHGAAVGLESAGVLLVGKGGSGKSTSAMACLAAGLKYAGDDYCAVTLDPEPVVYSLYNTCKFLGDDDLARFPGLASRVWNQVRTGEDKATVFLNEHWPERVVPSLPLKAVLVPRITGAARTTLRPCGGMEALAAVAPATMAQLPSSDGQDLKLLSTLVRRLPTFVIELGTDVDRIPAAILEFLGRFV